MKTVEHLETNYLHAEAGDVELSVIVPVYMGRTVVEELCERLVTVLETISPDFEILLVDDRAPDEVWPIIISMGAADGRIKGIRLSRNFGQHPALTAGIDHARGRWLVVMDCDLQDSPEDIPELYRKATREGFDVVIALRREHNIGRRRRLSSFVFNRLLARLGDLDVRPEIGNFRILSRKVSLAFQLYREQFRLFPALMARLGFSYGYVEVTRPDRKDGDSAYSFRRLMALGIDALISNSEKPLWLGIYFGVLAALFAFMLAIYGFVNWLLFGSAVEGWASLFIAISFFSGIQLLFAGIMGIYLGRVYNEAKRRPLYLVAEVSQLGNIPEIFAKHDPPESCM